MTNDERDIERLTMHVNPKDVGRLNKFWEDRFQAGVQAERERIRGIVEAQRKNHELCFGPSNDSWARAVVTCCDRILAAINAGDSREDRGSPVASAAEESPQRYPPGDKNPRGSSPDVARPAGELNQHQDGERTECEETPASSLPAGSDPECRWCGLERDEHIQVLGIRRCPQHIYEPISYVDDADPAGSGRDFCCGERITYDCLCGQTYHCNICRNGAGAIPHECASEYRLAAELCRTRRLVQEHPKKGAPTATEIRQHSWCSICLCQARALLPALARLSQPEPGAVA
jgi:hypothetical protein